MFSASTVRALAAAIRRPNVGVGVPAAATVWNLAADPASRASLVRADLVEALVATVSELMLLETAKSPPPNSNPPPPPPSELRRVGSGGSIGAGDAEERVDIGYEGACVDTDDVPRATRSTAQLVGMCLGALGWLLLDPPGRARMGGAGRLSEVSRVSTRAELATGTAAEDAARAAVDARAAAVEDAEKARRAASDVGTQGGAFSPTFSQPSGWDTLARLAATRVDADAAETTASDSTATSRLGSRESKREDEAPRRRPRPPPGREPIGLGRFAVNGVCLDAAKVAADVLCAGLARDDEARRAFVEGEGPRHVAASLCNAARRSSEKIAETSAETAAAGPAAATLALLFRTSRARGSSRVGRSDARVDTGVDAIERAIRDGGPGEDALAVALASLLERSMAPLCALGATNAADEAMDKLGGRAAVVDTWRPLAEGAASSLRWLAHAASKRGRDTEKKYGAENDDADDCPTLPEPALATLARVVHSAAVDSPAAGSDAGSAVILALAALAESARSRKGAAALMRLGGEVNRRARLAESPTSKKVSECRRMKCRASESSIEPFSPVTREGGVAPSDAAGAQPKLRRDDRGRANGRPCDA